MFQELWNNGLGPVSGIWMHAHQQFCGCFNQLDAIAVDNDQAYGPCSAPKMQTKLAELDMDWAFCFHQEGSPR